MISQADLQGFIAQSNDDHETFMRAMESNKLRVTAFKAPQQQTIQQPNWTLEDIAGYARHFESYRCCCLDLACSWAPIVTIATPYRCQPSDRSDTLAFWEVGILALILNLQVWVHRGF